MKTKLLLFSLLSILVYCKVAAQDQKIRVDIPKGYSGWVMITGSPTATNKHEIIIDKNGVGYVDTSVFRDNMPLAYHQDGKVLTDTELKFFFIAKVVPKEFLDLPVNDPSVVSHQKKVYAFYVLSESELARGEKYWSDEKNFKKVDLTSQQHIYDYIKQGLVVVN